MVEEHEEELLEIEETESGDLAEANSAELEERAEDIKETNLEEEELSEPVLTQEPDLDDSLTEVEIVEDASSSEEEELSSPEEGVDELEEEETVADDELEEAKAEIIVEDELEEAEAERITEVVEEETSEVEEAAAPETEAPEAETVADDEADDKPITEPDDDRHWYVVHCYSGYENKVRHNLEQRIETMGMKNKIFDVVVPTEEEIEVKDGKRRTVERRVFPGYILVQMLMDEDSWYVVRNTPGVTGFVGMGNDPTPLRQEEVAQIVKRMEADAPRIKVAYKTGQKVRIIDGPFNDFIGTVADINMERAKVRIMVSFFGRETPVELDFLQVEKA